MYHLVVFEPGVTAPIGKVAAVRASEVLTLIPILFADHPGCERIEISLDGSKLFTVDRAGNQIA